MAFLDPRQILAEFQIEPGSTVADFGAGTGFYTAEAARLVGESGRVYAIDIQPELITKAKSHLTNSTDTIEYICADIEQPGDTHLAQGLVDAVIFSNLLFQLDDKAAGLREAWRVLKPGGRLLLVDWSDSFGGVGPPEELVVSVEAGQKLAEAIGFSLLQTIPKAGDHHWALVLVKPTT